MPRRCADTSRAGITSVGRDHQHRRAVIEQRLRSQVRFGLVTATDDPNMRRIRRRNVTQRRLFQSGTATCFQVPPLRTKRLCCHRRRRHWFRRWQSSPDGRPSAGFWGPAVPFHLSATPLPCEKSNRRQASRCQTASPSRFAGPSDRGLNRCPVLFISVPPESPTAITSPWLPIDKP